LQQQTLIAPLRNPAFRKSKIQNRINKNIKLLQEMKRQENKIKPYINPDLQMKNKKKLNMLLKKIESEEK